MRRRNFLQTTSVSAALASGLPLQDALAYQPQPMGKAEHCIMIWLGGGMAQIDTFDPKAMGDAKAKKAGSYYPAIDTAVSGVQVCEHLKESAKLMDRITALRTVHHNVVDEHAAATNRMHTGRVTSGTVQYPSLGSMIAHERGAASPGVPAYMLIGYPNLTRGPGFLGQKGGFVYLTDVESGPAGLARPASIGTTRQSRRERLLETVRTAGEQRFAGDALFEEYNSAMAESLRLSGPEFMKVFDLKTESDDVRTEYGEGFGQRMLLSRRLCEAGVRFIEVSHNMNFRNGTGWDTHNDGQLNQHLLIQELDQSLAALIRDLEARQMLDKTLIVINSEFGRPAQFDSGGGRGHHSKCFSMVLAGGGLNHCGAYGVSDELAMEPVENPVGVPDAFATILACLQIDPTKNLYDGDRPVPITDQGQAIKRLLT
ncbi:DUF1501 domain-containing protein [Fuerstiella marisgermanici]|uniref:DUF1501 domain-containing protein n=1 Tax=Fuerstiella marisgermanici TaxID=1891926 RepID=A0A1P8WDH7_9PLAN|nr:DUF1501 domain-containing protein [Fuerstiella marisgermanici]APZ92112.1 hypothetical protein Fuma_01716 [Fuerstiella marisgermanici]